MGAKSSDRPVPCESGLELTILINSLRRLIESYIPPPKLKYTAISSIATFVHPEAARR